MKKYILLAGLVLILPSLVNGTEISENNMVGQVDQQTKVGELKEELGIISRESYVVVKGFKRTNKSLYNFRPLVNDGKVSRELQTDTVGAIEKALAIFASSRHTDGEKYIINVDKLNEILASEDKISAAINEAKNLDEEAKEIDAASADVAEKTSTLESIKEKNSERFEEAEIALTKAKEEEKLLRKTKNDNRLMRRIIPMDRNIGRYSYWNSLTEYIKKAIDVIMVNNVSRVYGNVHLMKFLFSCLCDEVSRIMESIEGRTGEVEIDSSVSLLANACSTLFQGLRCYDANATIKTSLLFINDAVSRGKLNLSLKKLAKVVASIVSNEVFNKAFGFVKEIGEVYGLKVGEGYETTLREALSGNYGVVGQLILLSSDFGQEEFWEIVEKNTQGKIKRNFKNVQGLMTVRNSRTEAIVLQAMNDAMNIYFIDILLSKYPALAKCLVDKAVEDEEYEEIELPEKDQLKERFQEEANQRKILQDIFFQLGYFVEEFFEKVDFSKENVLNNICEEYETYSYCEKVQKAKNILNYLKNNPDKKISIDLAKQIIDYIPKDAIDTVLSATETPENNEKLRELAEKVKFSPDEVREKASKWIVSKNTDHSLAFAKKIICYLYKENIHSFLDTVQLDNVEKNITELLDGKYIYFENVKNEIANWVVSKNETHSEEFTNKLLNYISVNMVETAINNIQGSDKDRETFVMDILERKTTLDKQTFIDWILNKRKSDNKQLEPDLAKILLGYVSKNKVAGVFHMLNENNLKDFCLEVLNDYRIDESVRIEFANLFLCKLDGKKLQNFCLEVISRDGMESSVKEEFTNCVLNKVERRKNVLELSLAEKILARVPWIEFDRVLNLIDRGNFQYFCSEAIENDFLNNNKNFSNWILDKLENENCKIELSLALDLLVFIPNRCASILNRLEEIELECFYFNVLQDDRIDDSTIAKVVNWILKKLKEEKNRIESGFALNLLIHAPNKFARILNRLEEGKLQYFCSDVLRSSTIDDSTKEKVASRVLKKLKSKNDTLRLALAKKIMTYIPENEFTSVLDLLENGELQNFCLNVLGNEEINNSIKVEVANCALNKLKKERGKLEPRLAVGLLIYIPNKFAKVLELMEEGEIQYLFKAKK